MGLWNIRLQRRATLLRGLSAALLAVALLAGCGETTGKLDLEARDVRTVDVNAANATSSMETTCPISVASGQCLVVQPDLSSGSLRVRLVPSSGEDELPSDAVYVLDEVVSGTDLAAFAVLPGEYDLHVSGGEDKATLGSAVVKAMGISLLERDNPELAQKVKDEGTVTASMARWEINTAVADSGSLITDDEAALFSEAVKDETAYYHPVAVLAEQLAADTTYTAYLCQMAESGKAEDATWAIATVSLEATSGDSSIDRVEAIDLENLGVAQDFAAPMAWEMRDVAAGDAPKLPEEAQTAFDGVEFAGAGNVVPLALLATQAIGGTNYLFLAQVGDARADEPVTLSLIAIYRDENGASMISSSQFLDFGSYVS